MIPPALELAAVSAIGLAAGSFLNVCIYRLPRGESLAWPPSHCPDCGARIRWFDNVPVIGYLVLRGRCRSCRGRISPRYPLVEMATAAIFALHDLSLGLTPLLGVRLVFASAMMVLFVIDLQHRILPNRITLPGIVLGLGASVFLDPGWRSALAGAVIGGGMLWLVAEVYLRARGVEGMGMGDVKMLAMIGAFLGWPLTILTVVGASVIGALAGVLMMAVRKTDLKYALPFGTFLAMTAVGAGLWGQPIVDWYAAYFR
jgi:leader peptidase (prepilin peptidase)/N-methyltransferase